MVRTSVVAGMFYEEDKEKLNQQIEKCFMSKFGPKELPSDRNKRIIGIIAPHAGYSYSGAGQAYSYKELGEAEIADVYIILGTAHMGFPKAALTTESFETPFGVLEVDKEFADKLIEKKAVVSDKYPHVREHSIEVQLPFLQFVNKDRKFKILPIVVGQDTDYEKLGKVIANISKELNRKIVLICSSDFTHYGANYGFIPFKDNVKENMYKLDKDAIKWIEKFDAWSFLDYIKETGATICGAYAIAVFIEACKALGGKEVKLLNYYTSGDVVNDYDTAVGYGSLVVR